MESIAEIAIINLVKGTTYSGNCPSHKFTIYGVSNIIGKEINIILGESASKLKHIWEQAGVSLADKKKQAGYVVRKLIYDKTSKHIAIDAITQNVKGKIKYIAKRIFITI